MSSDHPPIIDYEGSDYQTTFWEKGGRAYEDQVEFIAMRRLLPKRGKLLLELGAGAGRHSKRYAGFERIILLDYSLTQLQQAQEKLGKNKAFTFVAADIYEMPFVDGLFDAATMVRVLHHMADAPRAIKQIRRVLQPGAKFILEYANKHNLKAIIRYLVRRQKWNPFSQETIEFVTLNFNFHPTAMRRLLQENQFMVKRQLTVSHFRMNLLKRFFPLWVLVFMDSLAQYTGGWWQLTPSVFILNKAVGDTPVASSDEFFSCPACKSSPLNEHNEIIRCPACDLQWLIRNGIYDFRKPLS